VILKCDFVKIFIEKSRKHEKKNSFQQQDWYASYEKEISEPYFEPQSDLK